MNKQQRDNLGLTQIYDLIVPASSFLAKVKRENLARPGFSLDEARSAYSRRAALILCLKRSAYHQWQELLAHLAPISLPSQDTALNLPDLFELKSFIYHYELLKAYVMQQKLEAYTLPQLAPLFTMLDPEASGLPGFRLSPLFSSELAKLDKARQELNLKLQKARHAWLEEAKIKLDIPHLKQSFCLSRSEGELIHSLKASPYFVLTAESVANLSFSLADSALSNNLKVQIAQLNPAIASEEERVLNSLSNKVFRYRNDLATAIATCAELGWDYMLADFAVSQSCCIPELEESGANALILKGMRNLPLELAMQQQKRRYQSLDLDFRAQTNLITGPNMGGKTSLLKCLAQCAELSRRAIPLPAQKAQLPLYQYVYYNNEQEDDNLSSFGAEVVAFQLALKQPGSGLYLLDEFAKGTNPHEGEALATAVISYLAASQHTTIAATHYTKPASIKGIAHFQIKGIERSFSKQMSPDRSVQERLRTLAAAMDYSLLSVDENSHPPMDAIRIAAILGMPAEILKLVEEHIDA